MRSRFSGRVALIGNPNTGKTTVFDALLDGGPCRLRSPASTTEPRVATIRQTFPNVRAGSPNTRAGSDSRSVEVEDHLELIDLPGLTSLSPGSLHEVETIRALAGRVPGVVPPDLFLYVLDADNLRRTLYLFHQIRELGFPVVVVLTMQDRARERGIRLEPQRLSQLLEVPVIEAAYAMDRSAGSVASEALDGEAISRFLFQTLHQIESQHTGEMLIPVHSPQSAALPEVIRRAAEQLVVQLASDGIRCVGCSGCSGGNVCHRSLHGDLHDASGRPIPYVAEKCDALSFKSEGLELPIWVIERLLVDMNGLLIRELGLPSSAISHFMELRSHLGDWKQIAAYESRSRYQWVEWVVAEVSAEVVDTIGAVDTAQTVEVARRGMSSVGTVSPVRATNPIRVVGSADFAEASSVASDTSASEASDSAELTDSVDSTVGESSPSTDLSTSTSSTSTPAVWSPPRFRDTSRADRWQAWGDRVDRFLTHRVYGVLVLGVVLLTMFQMVFVLASPASSWLESCMLWLEQLTRQYVSPGIFHDMLIGGVIAGVGGIVTFLPQILILYFLIAILEESRYMVRVALLMDRLMIRFGLRGRSLIPLLSSCACTIPGILAARSIEDPNERLRTVLVSPLITCSARLPAFTLFIAAFIPATSFLGGVFQLQGLVLLAMYLLGTLAAILSALLLRRTFLPSPVQPLLMEIPRLRMPSFRVAFHRVYDRAVDFLTVAGTTILVMSILLWAATYFPRGGATESEHWQHSYLGRFATMIEPVFRPAGWDGRVGTAILASITSRERVVSNLGILLYAEPKSVSESVESGLESSEASLDGRGGDLLEGAGEGLQEVGVGAMSEVDSLDPVDPLDHQAATSDPTHRLWSERLHAACWEGTNRPLFTLPSVLGLLVFTSLCLQCAATLAVLYRETRSWRWPALAFCWQTLLAYMGAVLTYQLGTFFMGGV